MSKVLIVSDIHIHDYPQRNPSDRYRLYQDRLVCQNIIDAGKREGCNVIFIAGDILEKSIIRPYIQAEVKLFLDTLMKHFDYGAIIWGNHDQDNKSSDQHFNDSCLSVMLPPNLYYKDKEIETIDNTTIAFSNWRPEFDLSFIPGKVDLLVTHATINYGGGDAIKSQDLDESKFDLCVSGDIHRPAQSGKYVSIGIPQKCKMGDYDGCSGIVFDCITKEWHWTDLNPSGNLMKFMYTPNLEEEGWDETTGTWKVYKRERAVGGTSGEENLNIPQWEEIDHLVSEIINTNGLWGTHTEVLSQIKDIAKNEVDFSFEIQRFACQNWRSIDDVELYFDPSDRILITGKNGSGKSSLLSALKYAFVENRSLKDFVQFGTKECSTEVDFLYQGNIYRISRGYNATKGRSTFGLGIFDDAGNLTWMKYNNKKEFENDLLLRFPFIQYIDDIMFFDPDHNKLLADIAKKELDADIISKFFKLDKIDTLNDQAQIILKLKTRDQGKWEEEIRSNTEKLNYIQSRLSLIPLPPISREELESQKQQGLEIQRMSKEWTDWVSRNNMLTAKQTVLTQDLENRKIERAGCRDLKDIDKDIFELKGQMEEISTVKIPALKDIERDIKYLEKDIAKLNKDGSELFYKYQELHKTRVCPTCGKEMDKPVDLEATKAEMEYEMGSIKKKIEELSQKLSIKQAESSDVPFKLMSYQEELGRFQIQMNTLNRERDRIPTLDNEIMVLERNLDSVLKEINSKPAPQPTELPPNFIEIMSKIEQGLSAWQEIEMFQKDEEAVKGIIMNADIKLQEILDEVSNLEKYIKLTSGTGKIFEEIMTRLAEQFSDNQVKYEVLSSRTRGKDKLKFLSSFCNKGNWVAYDNCSSGQKTILDIHYLSKIITKMGFLVMDEFLKHLDPLNHDICIDMISQCNVGCIMLSSHMESISNFHNKTCSLELNDNGSTMIKLE